MEGQRPRTMLFDEVPEEVWRKFAESTDTMKQTFQALADHNLKKTEEMFKELDRSLGPKRSPRKEILHRKAVERRKKHKRGGPK